MFSLKIAKQDDGSWVAYDENRYEGDASTLDVGRGASEQEAINDLADALDGSPEGVKLIRDVLALMRKGSLAVVSTKVETLKCSRCSKGLDEAGCCPSYPCPLISSQP